MVRVHPDTGGPWVGNFHSGQTRFSGVWLHPNGRTLIIVAAGWGYVVDANMKMLQSILGSGDYGDIDAVLNAQPWFVVASYTCVFVVYDNEVWRSPCVALDRIRNLRVADGILYGEGWVGYEEEDYEPFRIDLGRKALLTKPYG